jgi:DNA/RNA endonuclease YhcR with UshA esterase domain
MKKIINNVVVFALVGIVGGYGLYAHAETKKPSSAPISKNSKNDQNKSIPRVINPADDAKAKEMQAIFEKIRKAFEEEDYSLFRAAVKGNTAAETITEKEFATIIESQKILERGGFVPPAKHKTVTPPTKK